MEQELAAVLEKLSPTADEHPQRHPQHQPGPGAAPEGAAREILKRRLFFLLAAGVATLASP